MKVVFFGSSIHSLKIIGSLNNMPDVFLVGLVSQPDRPEGRKQEMITTPVSQYAKNNNLPVFKPDSLPDKPWELKNPEELFKFIKKLKPDIIVVAYFGQKIPTEIINFPKYGILNIHPSLLPEYPGSSPVAYAIMDGKQETGVTIIKMNEKFDAGEIVAQEKEEIRNTDIPETLYERLFTKGANLLTKILPDYMQGKIRPKSQGRKTTAYARRLTKEDGKIDWKWEPARIERFIRAMDPWPGAWTEIELRIKNKQSFSSNSELRKRLKILKAHLENDKLILDQVQLEGKKPVNWEEFKRGYPEAKLI
ncbi:MAG: methionyl-tRNA formyltransferase [Candidatus Gottesmanbacteria bacterium]